MNSLAKALLWRAIAASNTLIMGTILSKNVTIAAKIAGTDTLIKTALFFVNERAWTRIGWGKVYEIVSMIPACFHVWFRARARVNVSIVSPFIM